MKMKFSKLRNGNCKRFRNSIRNEINVVGNIPVE